MIVNDVKPTVEMSTEMEGISFGIGDMSIVFDVLRSKLYSAPIASVCREICTNARDTMVAVGKGDQPIQITLPNAIEPNLRIKDWGEGISEDRIRNIFVLFGASTKRETNNQVGYFGLGAKSIGAIASSYVVETVVDGTKRSYSYVLDETKLGKLVKMSEAQTDETNGTEIVIPIAKENHNTVNAGIEFACRHWDPKPTIKGGKIEWKEPKWVIEGSNWKIATSSGYNREVKLILANIEYPLDHTQLPDYHNIKLFKSIEGTSYLYFDTGDLTIAANREAVHLDEATIGKIVKRAEEAYKELTSLIQSKIDVYTTHFEANKAYAKLRTTLSTIISGMNLEWQGKKLRTSLSFYGLNNWIKGYTYSNSARINFTADMDTPIIYVNDIEPNAEDKKKGYELLNLTKEVLTPFFANIKAKEALILTTDSDSLKTYTKDYSLNEFDLRKLSDYLTITPKKETVPRITVFKLIGSKFTRTKYLDYKNDTNEKVICVLNKHSYSPNRFTELNGKTLHGKDIAAIVGERNASVYGIDKETIDRSKDDKETKRKAPKEGEVKSKEDKARSKEDKVKTLFKGAKSLDAFVKECYEKTNIDYTKIKAVKYVLGEVGYNSIVGTLEEHSAMVLHRMTNKKSELVKALETIKEYRAYYNTNYDKLTAYESIVKVIGDDEVKAWRKENAGIDLVKLDKAMLKDYPLLGHISYGAPKPEHLIDYINLVDQSKAKHSDIDNTKETTND